MALSHSPRKVPLAGSDDEQPPRKAAPSLTRRVFFCAVVVENPVHGRDLPEDVQELIASLGDPLDFESGPVSLRSRSESNTELSQEDSSGSIARKKAIADSSALSDIITELVATERSYVNRLRTLKCDYADPLRTFARNKDTAIIPPYEAKTLFGNIDILLPVNEAFLTDLERMITPEGPTTVGGVGDVALKHFKSKGFDYYKQYYVKREEAQLIFEREMRKSSGFPAFVDRIKYSTADVKNRIGLRELLMEPVQRIPRYTLMFREMIKHMSPGDSQRAALVEADKIASKIALAETDEQTWRAAIMYCLGAAIDDFPPALISNSRRFIDCIDVEDVLADLMPSTVSGSGQGTGNLHASLFLFDDKLMIVKRPGNGDRGARALSGLDDLEKLTKSGTLPSSRKKSGMSCKGVIDVTDLVVTDIGGPDIHMYIEKPPQDQGDRWSGRPFRALSIVVPPSPINLDPTRTETDKRRFLENLWSVQANFRTRQGQSVVLHADEREVENRGGKVTTARTFFNLYQRTAYMRESSKTKVVLHIDPLGSADPIPFGIQGPPFVVVRVQPMAGDLSRYIVTSSDVNDDGEEDIVQSARVPGRVVQTIHQFGLFKFRTGNNSTPSTPTASTRSRAAIFGLDAVSLSRNLFARPGSGKGDTFAGSISHHRRSKTAVSRSSASTSTTGDSSLSRFTRTRSNSTTTVTTLSSIDDEQSIASVSPSSRKGRPLSRAKKLIKRGKSLTDGSESDPEASPYTSKLSQDAISREQYIDYSDYEDNTSTPRKLRIMDESERDLTLRLELARQNSQNQHGQSNASSEEQFGEGDFEDEHIFSAPSSRMSKDMSGVPERSTTPRPSSTTPRTPSRSPSRRPRTMSQQDTNRRLLGPRAPSPLPLQASSPLPSRRPLPSSMTDASSMDADLALDDTLVNMTRLPPTPDRSALLSPLPRSKRQPFETVGATPKAATSTVPIEPLSIKKRTSVRTTSGSERTPSVRKVYSAPRHSPWSFGSPRRPSFQNRHAPTPEPTHSIDNEDAEYLLRLSEKTREGIESTRRALKRIKLDVEKLRARSPDLSFEESDRSISPVKGRRIAQHTTPPITREAQARMEEMRKLIGKRVEGGSTSRPQSLILEGSISRISDISRSPDTTTRSLDDTVSQADNDLRDALKSHETVYLSLKSLAASLKEKSAEVEKLTADLKDITRKFNDLNDNHIDILREEFNAELEGMFNDANLPEDEAWAAMTRDLKQTKKLRNDLMRENEHYRRRVDELETQNAEWGEVLRAHGLIS